MDINKYLQSKNFRRVLVALALIVVIFASFGAGVFVGYQKARFSYAWSENYDRNFGGPPRGIFGIPPSRTSNAGTGFPGAHGVFGTILNMASSDIALNVQGGAERTVRLSSSTIIKEQSENIGQADLEVGEPIVVIGSPNNLGQIDARLIRVMR